MSQGKIHCDSADVGCEHVSLREEMLQHNSECMPMHLQLGIEMACVMLEMQTSTRKEAIFQIVNISSLDGAKKPWFSPAFYTSPGGYKMRISVQGSSSGTFGFKKCFILVFSCRCLSLFM